MACKVSGGQLFFGPTAGGWIVTEAQRMAVTRGGITGPLSGTDGGGEQTQAQFPGSGLSGMQGDHTGVHSFPFLA